MINLSIVDSNILRNYCKNKLAKLRIVRVLQLLNRKLSQFPKNYILRSDSGILEISNSNCSPLI